ncbi:hypothetical protein ACFW24_22245 [Streptomyces nigra]|uniref:hypothetical protein n=1 Tax=Streptomyces nigra TaxID=1827580 RepID=UPI0036A3F795
MNVGKSTLVSKPGSIEAGRAYDIEVRGRQVTLYLDGQEWARFTDDKPAEPFRVSFRPYRVCP